MRLRVKQMRERRGGRSRPLLLVDAVWARRVVAELDRAGLPASELLSAVGLRAEQLTGPDALIPFNAHVRLFENAARALREPCFGFRLGDGSGVFRTATEGVYLGSDTSDGL